MFNIDKEIDNFFSPAEIGFGEEIELCSIKTDQFLPLTNKTHIDIGIAEEYVI